MARKTTTPARVEEFVLNTDRMRAKNSNGTSGAKLAYWFENSDYFIVVLRMNEVKLSGRETAYWMVHRVCKNSRHSNVISDRSGEYCFDRKGRALKVAIDKEFEGR